MLAITQVSRESIEIVDTTDEIVEEVSLFLAEKLHGIVAGVTETGFSVVSPEYILEEYNRYAAVLGLPVCEYQMLHDAVELFKLKPVSEDLKIPYGVRRICVAAVSHGCVRHLVLADTVRNLKSCCFAYCESLEDIQFNKNVWSIDNSAFEGCVSLKEIDLSMATSLYQLGAGAFRYCSNLQKVVLPESMLSVGAICFSGCTHLQSVVIPKTVYLIGKSAFEGCDEVCLQVHRDSAGEKYAKENHIAFEYID